METLTSFSEKLAQKFTEHRPPNSVYQWDFRGEVGDMIKYDKTLIGVVSFNTSTEEIYANRTQRLEGTLTGQIFTEQMSNSDIYTVLDEMQAILYDYIGSLRYTEIGDAVVLQGTCDSILTQPSGEYWTFILPINLVVQF